MAALEGKWLAEWLVWLWLVCHCTHITLGTRSQHSKQVVNDKFETDFETSFPTELDDDEAEVKIVGGVKAGRTEFPWIANLRYKTSRYSFCGGALISFRFVVTAAHCLRGKNSWDISVVLGDYKIGVDDGTEEKIPVSKILSHPQYDRYTFKNDIGLVMLQRNATIGRVEPLALAFPQVGVGKELTGRVTVAGWGRTTEGGTSSRTLLKVDVPVVERRLCEARYNRKKPKMFCAGAQGKDSCQGDSGGAAVIPSSSGKWRLAGIVSHGTGCGRYGYPGIYTDASYYTIWILDTMATAWN